MGTHLQLHHLAVPGAAQNERSRFSINLLSLSTRKHYALIVYVVQSPHFDRHHVPFFKERTWNGPGFKITLMQYNVQIAIQIQRKILWLNNYYTSVNNWEKKEVILDLSRRSFIQEWLWPKGSGMKVLEILWTQKRPKLKKNKCMFSLSSHTWSIGAGRPSAGAFSAEVLLPVVMGGSWFPRAVSCRNKPRIRSLWTIIPYISPFLFSRRWTHCLCNKPKLTYFAA